MTTKDVLRNSWLPLVAGAFAGSLIGLLVFYFRDKDEWYVFAGVGAAIGLLIALTYCVVNIMKGKFEVESIKISVPSMTEVSITINRKNRIVAWQLFVETTTRIASQPLHHEHGYVREALNSLYALFGTTRKLLAEVTPDSASAEETVELVAVTMLNQELRPFMSKWHKKLSDHEKAGGNESSWTEKDTCRKELEQLRKHMKEYVKAFGKLAGVKHPERFLDPAAKEG